MVDPSLWLWSFLLCPVTALFALCHGLYWICGLAVCTWSWKLLWYRAVRVSVAAGVSNEASGDQDPVHGATDGSQDLPC